MELSLAPNISPCSIFAPPPYLTELCTSLGVPPLLSHSVHPQLQTSVLPPKTPYTWIILSSLISSSRQDYLGFIKPGVILETGREKWWSSLSMLTDIFAAVAALVNQANWVKHHTGFGLALAWQRQVHQCLTRCWKADVSSAQRPTRQPGFLWSFTPWALC